MKVLVTGGAGYIGSMLTPMLLEQGHSVRILDSLMHGGRSMLGFWSHPEFGFVRGDVRDADVVETAIHGVDAIVHLAAIVGDPACARDPELARQVNQEASLALIQRAEAAGVQRFIFASTCSNYGRMSDPLSLVDETSELQPVSLYAETKVAIERYLLDLGASDLVPTVLRFATVFGVSPRMRFDLTVNEFTLDMLVKQELTVFGEQFWRPYVHVRDVARAVSMALGASADTVRNEVFNVGATSENYQKQGLVELIQPYAPDAVVEYVHKTEDPRDYKVSFDKVERELGFEITKTVADGVREVAALVEEGFFRDSSEPGVRN
jgi:nucleoside-diphosphate-sugar epimerase